MSARFEAALKLSQQPTTKGTYSPAQWHWKFIAAYAGAALVYFAGGYVYNNKVFGLSGREAVPHSQFWFMDLRGLVADGCYYSLDIAKVRFTSLPRALCSCFSLRDALRLLTPDCISV